MPYSQTWRCPRCTTETISSSSHGFICPTCNKMMIPIGQKDVKKTSFKKAKKDVISAKMKKTSIVPLDKK